MLARGALLLASGAVSVLALSAALDVTSLAALPVRTPEWVCDAGERLGLKACRVAAPVKRDERIAAAATGPGSGPAQASRPWDSPAWSAQVASKVLDSIAKVSDDQVETGSLPEPWIDPAPEPEAAPATGRPVASPPAPPESPKPVAVPAKPREPSPKPQQAAAPAEPAPAPVIPPPALPAAVVIPSPASEPPPLPPSRPRETRQANLGSPEEGTSGRASSSFGDGAARRKAAEEVAGAYLRALSAPRDVSSAQLRRLMAERIEFYGKPISRSAWQSRRDAFAEKWPVRDYGARPGSMAVECDGESHCTVRAMVDWTTVDPSRADAVRGTSRLELRVDLSGRQPVIDGENLLLVRNTVRRSLKDPPAVPEPRMMPEPLRRSPGPIMQEEPTDDGVEVIILE